MPHDEFLQNPPVAHGPDIPPVNEVQGHHGASHGPALPPGKGHATVEHERDALQGVVAHPAALQHAPEHLGGAVHAPFDRSLVLTARSPGTRSDA